MKSRLPCLFCAAILLLCFISSDLLIAAEWHIKPTTEVLLRRGQGTDFKIDGVLSDGTKVSLLEVDGDWAKIQLANGREGWTLRRYLTDEIPLKDQVIALEESKAELQEELAGINVHLSELIEVNSQTEQDLAGCTVERDTIRNDFQHLQQDTADVVQTKELLVATEKKLSELSNRLTGMELENEEMKKNSSLRWFLTGAGVLLAGLFLGLIVGKRSKKRYGSLS